MGNLKVLICDDSMLIRKKLTECLEQIDGVEVREVANGQAAVDCYKEYTPDIVFMDIVMPVIDGIEALSLIKKMDASANIIMLSSTGTQSYLKKAIAAGAVDFIQKPWQDSQIKLVIDKALKERTESHV